MLTSELQVPFPQKSVNDEQSRSDVNVSRDQLILQEVQALVNRATGSNAAVQKFSLKSYSDGKLGFLGSHQKLQVEVKSANGRRDTLSFFVKLIPYDVPCQAEYVLDKCVFLKESTFYRDIVPHLYHEYKDEPWTATCYLVKENLLVFEDLDAKGYTIRDKLFSKELIVSGLTSLARLHASSLLAEARLGKSLRKLYPHAFAENAFVETGKTKEWFDVSVNAVVAIAEHLDLDSSLIPKACNSVYSAMCPSSPKCLLIDFQLLRYSPLAHDVIQFLYLVADRDFRVKWEETMLKHYYSVLCEILNSAKSTAVEIPSWSELIEGIEEQRLAAVITATIYHQTVLIDEKLSAQIFGDSESYHEFEFINRNEKVLEIMEIDPVYKRRLTEAVTELVELSFRLDELPKPT